MIKRTNKGFTLVELIVVIVILAILATIAFITLQDYPIQARDTKRISEVGALADKVNLVTADGKTGLDDLVTGTLTPVTITNWGVTYSGSLWNINYVNLNESADAFKDPVSGNPYKIMYLEGGTGTGAVKCFEVGSFSELDNTPIVKGNCAAAASKLWGNSGLFSGGAHSGVLETNTEV